MPLTDVAARNAKPRPTPYKLADGGGLNLMINPNGSKLWRLRYSRAGRETMISLGAYPAVGLAQARSAAESHRATIAGGSDPAVEKRRQQAQEKVLAGNTFADAYDAYLARKTRWAAATRKRFKMRMKKDVLPAIGTMPLDRIEAIDVVSAVQPILDRGAIDNAKRTVNMIGAVMGYAIVLGRARSNPAIGIAEALEDRPPVRHRPAILDAGELGDFLNRLWEHPHESVAKELLKMILLTFARPGEVRGMRWADIDTAKATWTYHVSKVRLDGHIVPLSKQALAIIEAMRPLTGRHEFVFASPATGKQLSDPVPTIMITRLGIARETMSAHGARAIARTHLVEDLGFPEAQVEMQLSHRPRDANGRAYNRVQWLAERRRMMQVWADHLDGLRRKHRAAVLGIRGLDSFAAAG